MRMLTVVAAVFAAALGLAAATGMAGAHHREAGAHEHGRGTLNIALEGKRLMMELEAPGADIVGFEHEPRTDAQRAAIEKAEKQLAAPQTLFRLPAGAGCVLKHTKVVLAGDDHDHGHEHDAQHHDEVHEKGHKDHAHDGDAKAEHANDEHAAFRAEYAFDCKAPAGLTTIGFGYFKAFAGARRLDVTFIGPKGQSKFEVTRATAGINLGGMI